MSNIQKVKQYFEPTVGNLSRIEQVCKGFDVKGSVMDMMQILSKNTKLQSCTPLSVIGSIITASRLGISLDPNKKLAYLIPYGKECKLELSYMALIEIMSFELGIKLSAHVVYENDVFEPEYGGSPNLKHIPKCFGDKGNMIGVYAIAKYPDGTIDFECLDIGQIEACRKVSKNPNGVWKTWYNEMAKKSAIRRLFKRLPKTGKADKIAAYDEKTEIGEDISEFYDIDGVELPVEETASEALEEI